EVLIETTPDQLRGAGIAFSDLVGAARAAFKGEGPTVESIRNMPLGKLGNDDQATAGGAAARLGRVAQVRVAPGMSSGMADVDGARPVVAGIVIAKRDADIAGLLT